MKTDKKEEFFKTFVLAKLQSVILNYHVVIWRNLAVFNMKEFVMLCTLKNVELLKTYITELPVKFKQIFGVGNSI